jgi:hypothetical protein
MVCVYGLSHAPALLLLDFPAYGRGAFLLFFLVVVAPRAQLAQDGGQPLAAPAAGGAPHRPQLLAGAPGASARWPPC